MSKDELQQRIRYLIEHGGIYPRERWPPWVWVLLVVGLAGVVTNFWR